MSLGEIIPVFLAYGVLLVNGWTDAPNSIATAVSSGAISYKKASLLCGAFNMIGVIFACLFNYSVAEFVFSMGDFGPYTEIGISITFITMILFGVICYFLGLPSSESHAMLSAMAGVSFALHESINQIKIVGRVFAFTIFSCLLAYLVSYISRKLLVFNLSYKGLQIVTCTLTSFMHGWQGGLKIIGVIAFLLSIDITSSKIPIFLTLSVAIVLGIGPLIGSKRIIDSMGDGLIRMTHKSSFSSDIGTYLSLLVCSILGMPVSTGNIKCMSIIATGRCENQNINKKTATRLFVSFIAVFPICFAFGYILMKLILP